MKTVFLALTLMLAQPAAAIEYGSLGAGNSTCADFAQVMRDSPVDAEMVYMSWAGGYLTALSVAREYLEVSHLPVFYADSSEALYQTVWSRVRSYCNEHPLEDFVMAVLYASGT